MSDNLVDIKNMSFRRDERVIYDDISLSIPRGKVTAIMGPSGIGKTTLTTSELNNVNTTFISDHELAFAEKLIKYYLIQPLLLFFLGHHLKRDDVLITRLMRNTWYRENNISFIWT